MICKFIVIVDEDEVYLKRIFESLSNYQELNLEVLTFSDVYLAKSFVENNKVDLLLISSNLVDEVFLSYDVNKIILSNESKEGYLNKYTNVNEMISYIENLLCENDEYIKEESPLKDFKLITVHSFLEAGYKSAYALALSENYSSYGEVLYVNLEEFAGLGKAFKSDGGNNLSDLIYEFRKTATIKSENINKAIGKIGDFYFIEPCLCANDISKLDMKELYEMLEKVAEVLNFDYIVLEIGSMCLVPWDMYEKSDEIHIPHKKSISYKMFEFNNYLAKMGKDSIFNKIITKEISENLVPYYGFGFCDENLDNWCYEIKGDDYA